MDEDEEDEEEILESEIDDKEDLDADVLCSLAKQIKNELKIEESLIVCKIFSLINLVTSHIVVSFQIMFLNQGSREQEIKQGD